MFHRGSGGFATNFLEQPLGSQAQRNDYQDLIKRYEQGHPSEGYSDREVMDRYGQMTSRLPRDVCREAAEEAFARLSTEEREQFFVFMRQPAQQKQVAVPDLNDGGMKRAPDPG